MGRNEGCATALHTATRRRPAAHQRMSGRGLGYAVGGVFLVPLAVARLAMFALDLLELRLLLGREDGFDFRVPTADRLAYVAAMLAAERIKFLRVTFRDFLNLSRLLGRKIHLRGEPIAKVHRNLFWRGRGQHLFLCGFGGR